MRQNLELPFGRRASVAAHGGKNEGLGPNLLQVTDHGLHNGRKICDAPAADGDRYGVAAPDGQSDPGHRGLHAGRNVGQALPGKTLFHPIHLGEWHGG